MCDHHYHLQCIHITYSVPFWRVHLLFMWRVASPFAFQCDWQHQKLPFKWQVNKILIFHTKFKTSNHIFFPKDKCSEVWTSYNVWSKLRILWDLMLHHNSNIALQSIFSNFIPHNDTRIKASKVSNIRKIASGFWQNIVLKIPYHKLQYLREWQAFFLPKFHVMWQIGIPLVNGPTKVPCSIQRFVITFMPQSFFKLEQLGSTFITFNRHQSKFYDQSLQPWLSNLLCTNFFITWIILWT